MGCLHTRSIHLPCNVNVRWRQTVADSVSLGGGEGYQEGFREESMFEKRSDGRVGAFCTKKQAYINS